MTQEDLAQLIGKDRSAISKYESGACDIPGKVLERLAEIFQTTMEDILSRTSTSDPLPPPPTPRAALHALPPRRRASRAKY